MNLKQKYDIPLLVKYNTDFAFELYNNLKDSSSNIFLSPYSISAALAFVYAGARGKNEKEISTVINFPTDQEAFHSVFSNLHFQLFSTNKDIDLKIANALWIQNNYNFLDEYFLLVSKNYGNVLKYVDFITNKSEAVLEINKWIENNTNNNIKNFLLPQYIDDNTKSIITNSIYFKAKWENPFEEKSTFDENFRVSIDKLFPMPMMHLIDDFYYTETDKFQLLQLPYLNNIQSMCIILPKKPGNISKIEKTLTQNNLNKWISKLQKTEINVTLPRFKIRSNFSLSKSLTDLGLKEAFKPGADFSGMSNSKEIFLGNILHEAFVDVQEKGTEAAAITAAICVGGAPPVSDPIIFKADHPFIFLIRDNSTGTILFMGRFSDPSQLPIEN